MSRPASADEATDQARAHVKLAIAAYDEAKYDDAAREFEAAYKARSLPDLQYNLAQCYERLNRLPEAVSAYQRYLDGKPLSEDRPTIVARLTHLAERIAKQKAGEQPAPATVEREKVVLKTVIVYRDAPPPPGRALRGVAIGLGVLTVAALASGVSFAVLTSNAADTVTHGGDPTMPVPFAANAQAAETAGQLDRVLSFVSFGVAAVAAVGTIGLWALGNKVDREAAQVAIVPSLGPSSAGLAALGRF